MTVRLSRRSLLLGLSGSLLPYRAQAGTPTADAGQRRLPDHPCAIVELRQYTLHPGRRDVLIELFEKHFVTPQAEAGITLIGQFVDRDDPDRFVWVRGFASMAARAQALASFYGGPVWKVHRSAANDTMLDSDNVLLLHRLENDSPFRLAENRSTRGVYDAVVHYVSPELMPAFVSFMSKRLQERASEWGVDIVATLQTELGPNSFPQLPIRVEESVFVWFVRHATEAAEQSFWERMRRLSGWREEAPAALLPAFMRKPEILRLSPTAGSALI